MIIGSSEEIRYQDFLRRGSAHRKRCRADLFLLKDVVLEMEELYGYTIRRTWMYFLNNKNSTCMKIRNIGLSDQTEYSGCGNCNGCWMRFIKLIIVIQACQGLSDDICLTLFDYAFNEDPKYKEYTVEEWLTIGPKKLTALYWGCSCCYKNLANTLNVLNVLL